MGWQSDLSTSSAPSFNSHPSTSRCSVSSKQTDEGVTMMNKLITTNETLTKELLAKDKQVKLLESKIVELEKSNETLKGKLLATMNKGKSPKVAKDLSKIIRNLYPSLSDEEKFDINQHYNSKKNKEVKACIMSLVKENTDGEPDSDELKFAVHARYSLEKKRQKEQRVMEAARRITSRRHASYNSRLRTSLNKKLHAEQMKNATPADMSDLESEGEDTFIVKRPKWRTPEFQDILNAVDSYTTFKRKRVVGSPSKRNG